MVFAYFSNFTGEVNHTFRHAFRKRDRHSISIRHRNQSLHAQHCRANGLHAFRHCQPDILGGGIALKCKSHTKIGQLTNCHLTWRHIQLAAVKNTTGKNIGVQFGYGHRFQLGHDAVRYGNREQGIVVAFRQSKFVQTTDSRHAGKQSSLLQENQAVLPSRKGIALHGTLNILSRNKVAFLVKNHHIYRMGSGDGGEIELSMFRQSDLSISHLAFIQCDRDIFRSVISLCILYRQLNRISSIDHAGKKSQRGTLNLKPGHR